MIKVLMKTCQTSEILVIDSRREHFAGRAGLGLGKTRFISCWPKVSVQVLSRAAHNFLVQK
jgi:hypothetical protein